MHFSGVRIMGIVVPAACRLISMIVVSMRMMMDAICNIVFLLTTPPRGAAVAE